MSGQGQFAAPPRERGRRAGLTRQDVLDAALALADADGPESLSMRRIGTALGVQAMTVQHHVGSKDALLDALVAQLFREALTAEASLPEGSTWPEMTRALAHRLRATLHAHQHLTTLVATRPAVTRENLDLLETFVASLHRAGLTPGQALEITYAVVGFVIGQAGMEVGLDPQERRAQLAARDPAEWPTLIQGAGAPAWPDLDPFELVLDALLERFAELVGD